MKGELILREETKIVVTDMSGKKIGEYWRANRGGLYATIPEHFHQATNQKRISVYKKLKSFQKTKNNLNAWKEAHAYISQRKETKRVEN